MHRFFIASTDIRNQTFTSREKDLCHQLSKVLRIRPGETSLLLTNNETEHLMRWVLVSKSECSAGILKSIPKPDISSSRPIHLAVALLKNQNRWEWMLEKCVELGAASFTPLITNRVGGQYFDPKYFDPKYSSHQPHLRKPDRLSRIIQEAAEQSGRTLIPILKEPITFTKLLSQKGNKIIAILTEDKLPVASYELPVTILIGPEGGFTEDEVKQALKADCQPLQLGSQTLRTETAAIAAMITTTHGYDKYQCNNEQSN